MTLQWIADENVAQSIIDLLRLHGHTLHSVREVCPGSSDAHILEWALREQAVVLTEDKGFAEVLFRERNLRVGVVLLRLQGVAQEEKARITLRLMDQHAAEFKGMLTVVNKNKIRRRKP